MAKAILRIAKLTTGGNIGGLNRHCTRTMEVPNADPELRQYNRQLAGTLDMVKDVNDRIAAAGCKVRKNAVMAIEHLITASPEAFKYKKIIGEDGKPALLGNIKNWNNFESAASKWLIEQYGAENVVNVHVHKDEETPHIHAVVVPIKDGKLNARHFVNGREKLSAMQDSFSEAVKDMGIERGVKGSRAQHVDIKTFYGQLEADKERSRQMSAKMQEVAGRPPKIAITTPPVLTGREDWRKNQETAVNEQVKEYAVKVQDIATKIGDSVAEVQKMAGENKKLKQRTEKAEQENGKLKEELKKAVKEHEVLKDTLQFATRLEVNGKPFIEAFIAYKEQEKQQLSEEAKKQQKPEMAKVRWRRL
jgi:hypothetical protein